MRLAKVDEVRDGDRVGVNVSAVDGRLLLRQGMILTTRLIEGLRRLQIEGIYIEDERFKDVQLQDGLGLKCRMKAISALNNAFAEITQNGSFNSKPLIESSEELVSYLIKEPNPLVDIKNIRTRAGYLLDHSINVAMLSILTAKVMNYNTEQLRVIGIGAMLHDIGYALPGLRDAYAEHPKAGFDLIRQHSEIPLMAAHLVLQHHEMINGQGFPYGIMGKEIREMSQICAVANDFDHHINEIGKNRLPHEGIEYIMSKVETSYDIHILQAFMRKVVPYPLGTVVRLTNGITGIVTGVNKTHASRPVIREIDKDRTIALFDNQTLFIREVISSRDICFS